MWPMLHSSAQLVLITQVHTFYEPKLLISFTFSNKLNVICNKVKQRQEKLSICLQFIVTIFALS